MTPPTGTTNFPHIMSLQLPSFYLPAFHQLLPYNVQNAHYLPPTTQVSPCPSSFNHVPHSVCSQESSHSIPSLTPPTFLHFCNWYIRGNQQLRQLRFTSLVKTPFLSPLRAIYFPLGANNIPLGPFFVHSLKPLPIVSSHRCIPRLYSCFSKMIPVAVPHLVFLDLHDHSGACKVHATLRQLTIKNDIYDSSSQEQDHVVPPKHDTQHATSL